MTVESAARLAAVVFDRDEDADLVVRDFIASLATRGIRVEGLVQQPGAADGDVDIVDLATGARLPIMQELGAEAGGCAVDPAAIATAARLLDAARARKPDLLVVNRFGRLESEGGGMRAEIGAAAAEGAPVLICVPMRYCDAWDAFASGLDARLPPDRAALETWWDEVASGVNRLDCAPAPPRARGLPDN